MGDSRPLYSCVVRFKVLHSSKSATDAVLAGEEQAHLSLLERAAEKKFSNRNYLLILTAEALQLYATRDADFCRAGELAALLGAAAAVGAGDEDDAVLPSLLRGANERLRPVAPVTATVLDASLAGAEKLVVGAGRLLGMASTKKGDAEARNGATSASPRKSSSGDSGSAAEDAAAAGGSAANGAGLGSPGGAGRGGAVAGGANSGNGDEGEQADSIFTLSVALSQVVEVRQVGASAVVSFRRQKPRVRMLNRAEKFLVPWGKDSKDDPLLRTAVLAVRDEAAAAELTHALQATLARLTDAVKWIARGLPLNDAPYPMLVTVQPCGEEHTAAEVVATTPGWGKPIPLPAPWCQLAAAGGLAASGARVTVWLATPLGPAAAQIGVQQFVEAASGGQGPLVVEADVIVPACGGSSSSSRDEQSGGGGGNSAADRQQLHVQLQAEVHQSESKGQHSHVAGSSADETLPDPQPAADAATQPSTLAVAGMLVAVLAAWVQIFANSGPAPMLRWAAFAACHAAAAFVLLAASRQRGAARRGPVTAAGEAPRWSLTLLQASLVSGDEEALLQEVASEAGVGLEELGEDSRRGISGSSGATPETAEPTLPEPFRHFIKKHPASVDDNIASRFVATYPSHNKAFAALQQCVEWREQQGYVGLLDQQHPKFEKIKSCYPHAVLGWSSKKDCLVTLDSYGVWKESYDKLKAQGVTDDELLRHLMFCFDFNFTVLDGRHLPHGMSVNIIDLAGLKMSDAAGEAFRFISKAGALLNLHYPGRLHKAFLVNAPSWWSVVWRLVSPLIHPDTRKLMALFSVKDKAGAQKGLLEWIDASVLPADYGGESTAGLYDSPLEQQLWAHVRSKNGQAGAGAAAAVACGATTAAPAALTALPTT